MADISGCMSSKSCEWETPQALFDKLNEEFRFTLDVCADAGNHKCERFYTKAQDGLAQPWDGVCWCNPPYGSVIGRWVRKAYESSLGGGGSLYSLYRHAQIPDGGRSIA